MTQSSRPQADNIVNIPTSDAGPYSRDEWAERMRAAHTGDDNTAASRTKIRGVIPTYDNLLVPSEPVAGTVRVGSGGSMVYGSYLFSDADVDFNVAADPPVANPRIDLVCAVENNTNAVVDDGTAANGWIFPTDLTDYNGLSSIPAYSARLVIVKGAESAAPVAPALDQSGTLYMVEKARYQISTAPVLLSNFTDSREFCDIETIVGVMAADNATIIDAQILGAQVTDGVGAAGLGVGVRFKLEDDAGTLEDAARDVVRWEDATSGSEDARREVYLTAGGAENLSAVTVAPAAASADGNARGAGAVDLQQARANATEVASGAGAFIAGGKDNTASGPQAHAEGDGTAASGDASHAEGKNTIASGTASHAEGGATTASIDFAHAEGNATVASGAAAHAEGSTTVASGAAAHAEGYNNTASDDDAHAEGNSTVASGKHSHAEGSATTASGDAAHAEGNSGTASGALSHAEGFSGTASEEASHAGGKYAVASKHAQFARGGARFAANGDAQYSDYSLSISVTHSDAAWHNLTLDGVADLLTVAIDQVMTFDILLVGTTQGCTKSFGFTVNGVIENDGGTTTLLASSVTTLYDTDDTDFDAQVAADDANDALLLQVKDATSGGDTVRWVAMVRTAEVTFPA